MFYTLNYSEITNCTINYNSASTGGGGGLFATQSTHVRNSIIANSVTGGNCDNTGTSPTNSGNNIDSGTSCGWGSTDGSMSSTNPLLGTLKDNGGATKTMALLSSSPAIDAVIYNAQNGYPVDDQRDYPRPYGVRFDIGAVEQYYRILLPLVIRN